MTLLASGRIEIEGRMPWSSNGTYLCTVTADHPAEDDPAIRSLQAIYKPRRAERPLWDFPDGLYRREVAAYELAVDLAWDIVPETVERDDGPLGLGSLQRFVDADFEEHYFTLLEDEGQHPALQRMGVFDVLANNADRKGGHCLVDRIGHVWGIDHGLCFHTSPKLRTVIWDWAGEPVGTDVMTDVTAFVERGPGAPLRRLLSAGELEALVHRARELVAEPVFPEPRDDRPYPWPLV